MFVFNPFHIDLGIDLGTANTIVYAKNRGFICNEASYIALNNDNPSSTRKIHIFNNYR